MSAHSQRRSAGSARSVTSAPPRRSSLKIQNIDDLNGPQYASTVLDWIRWSSLKLEDQEREIIALKKELGREHTDDGVGSTDASNKPDKVLLLEAENSVLKKELLHARANVSKELEEKASKISELEANLRKLLIVLEMGKKIAGGDGTDVNLDFGDLGLGDIGTLIKIDAPDTAPDWLDAEIAAVSAKLDFSKDDSKGEKEDTIEEDDVGALEDGGGPLDDEEEAEDDPLPEDD